MIRGTTPQLIFNLPFDVSIIKTVWVTFSQFEKELFTVETDDVIMSGKTITVDLTQEQTLMLEPETLVKKNNNVEIQLRILTTGGDAIASNIMRTSADRILKEGVIT